MSCEYKLEKGVYYMVCENGEKVPVDIDAPPQFKAKIESFAKEILANRSKQRGDASDILEQQGFFDNKKKPDGLKRDKFLSKGNPIDVTDEFLRKNPN